MPRLSVFLLGPFRATLDGEPLAGLESDKVRALLAFLMVESGRPHRREELAGLLWPERPEGVARQDLSQALSNLRRATHDRTASPPFLDISRQDLRFNTASDYELDTATFLALLDGCSEHLCRPQANCAQCMARVEGAAELVAGPFLQGFSLPDCAAYEEWMLLLQERFQRLTIQALQRLSAWRSRRGEAQRAIAATRRWLELDPWQERAHRQLMGLLARNGERHAALEQYETCRAVLDRELGIEPEAETQQLCAAIRDGALAAGPAVLPSSPDLPLPMLPLLGREGELAEIEARLGEPDTRLLSLVGPGGSGKTHLALEVAFRQGDAYADGATVVGLVATQQVDGVAPAIAQACGLSLQPDRPALRQLLDYLRGKEMLLVLDNLEHLLVEPSPGPLPPTPGAAAPANLPVLLLEILRTAPWVRILVTSRVRLNLSGEQLLHVGGLATSEPDDEEALSSSPAVQLFLSTARRVRTAYDPDGEELRAIGSLCRLLSGMPLAILLAASWMEALGPAQILEQVARRYDFLEADWQDLPPRQRSVRAVLDHSWGLLSAREQEVLPRLSVFRGGLTVTAAEQVAGVSPGDLLRLVGKSFLVRQPSGRHEMHELLRQYAGERLGQGAESVRERHGAHYLAIAQWCGEELKGPRQGAALAELGVEAENLRAAWEWAVGRGDAARLSPALDGLCRLFERRGRGEEGAALCAAAAGRFAGAADDERRRLQARLLAWQGRFECLAGRGEHADRLAGESLGLLEQVDGDARSERAFALWVRGEAAADMGRWQRAVELHQQSLALYRALGDRWSSAQVLSDLGKLALTYTPQGDDAERWLDESLQLWRAAGDRAGTAAVLVSLGARAIAKGDLAQAERLVREAIPIHREAADQAGLAKARFWLAAALVYGGRFGEALPVMEESARLYRRLGQLGWQAAMEQTLCYVQMNLGLYEQARESLVTSVALFQESEGAPGLAYVRLAQATFTLLGAGESGSRACCEAAYRFAEESVAAFRALEHIDAGRAWAIFGYAAHCLGRPAEARQHLHEALRLARGAGAPQTLALVLAHLAATLADDQPEQAVALWSLAAREPHIGNSRLWQDLLGSRVAAAAARLPPEVVRAAQERGQEQDLAAAAEYWLRELAADRAG